MEPNQEKRRFSISSTRSSGRWASSSRPTSELKDFLLEQEVMLEAKHGIPFCPCQPVRHDRARDMQIVCPCIPFHREHFDAIKRCWCGLFVHKDVMDPDSLPQLPPKDVGLE